MQRPADLFVLAFIPHQEKDSWEILFCLFHTV
jgi:hypothetical protein